MALSIQDYCYGYNYKTTTTIYCMVREMAASNIAVGDLVIICVAADADATPTGARLATVTTSENLDTLTTHVTATNSGNTVVSISSAEVLAIPENEGTVYINVDGLSDAEAKAAICYVIRGHDSTPFDKSSSATGTGTSPNSGATDTLSQADEVVIGAIGMEHKDSDSTGSWTTGAGYVSGNEILCGTAANGSAANQAIRAAAEIVSATTAQTAEITGENDADWAACIATFKASVGGVSVTPAHAEAGASCVSPGVVLGSTTATPAMAESQASGLDPAVVLGSINITPAIAEALASGLDPLVILGSILLTPAMAESQTSGLDPAVAMSSISATPANAEAEASALDPSVQESGGDIYVTPVYVEALASGLDPAVVLGSILLTPDIAEALASGLDPAVVLGSVSTTPALAGGSASTIDPAVVLGSILLTPDIAEAEAAAIDPLVILGSILLTPAMAESQTSAIDPVLMMSSTTATPAQAIALALAADPRVLESEPKLLRWVALNLLTLGVGGRRK